MIPKFYIRELGAQNRSRNVSEYVTESVLKDICNKLTGSMEYEVEWIQERNIGRLIRLEIGEKVHYICLSQEGKVAGRNYLFQSVPTAYGMFLNELVKTKESNIEFWFYFLPTKGNIQTKYMRFMYRVMYTADIKFLNADDELPDFQIEKFSSVIDIINLRNHTSESNSGNQSTYITDEGKEYNIYGKTFGANQKETTLQCFAIEKITRKPVKLFQIQDNDSVSLSSTDIDAIDLFATCKNTIHIEILDDTYEFDRSENQEGFSLRSPRFTYNLLQKYNGEKKCLLCGCPIGEIVQGAHIYPISRINRRTDISNDKKLEYATDADNGMWLCENHHRLFDSNLLFFVEGGLMKSQKLSKIDKAFVDKITTNDMLGDYYNDNMGKYFKMRYEEQTLLA